MTCLLPTLFFLLPSLTHPGQLEKVETRRMEAVFQKISTEPEHAEFRNDWKKKSHEVCQTKGYHCAVEFIVGPNGTALKCVKLPKA